MLTRTRAIGPTPMSSGGYWEYWGGWHYGPTFESYVSSCTDTIGGFDKYGHRIPHALYISRKDRTSYEGLSCKKKSVPPYSRFYKELENWIPAFAYSLSSSSHPSLPATSDDVIAASLLARTNPSRAPMYWVTSALELRDLPRMYRDISKLLADGFRNPVISTARGNLTWQFGLRPMLNDIRKLFRFQEQVERKLRTLQKAAREGGVHRRIRYRTDSFVDSKSELTLLSAGGIRVYGSSTTTYRISEWATCYWRPTGTDFPRTLVQQRIAAERAVWGLTDRALASQIYEAIPWSWLIDWFWNLGDLLASTSNALHMRPGNICVMRSRDSFRVVEVTGGSSWVTRGHSWVQHSCTRERHLKTIVAPYIGIPLLTVNQWSLLASIGILRGRRPFGA